MEEKTTGQENMKDRSGRIDMTLFAIYMFFILLAAVIIGRIVYIQIFYKPESIYVERFTTGNRKVVIEPERGAILSHDGKTLAASTPKYQIAMDCTVRKQEFIEMTDRKKGDRLEAEWQRKARELAKGLSRIYGDRTAGEYYKMISRARRDNRQYIRIGGLIDHDTMQEVKALPLFEEGSYKGGLIIEKYDKRIYPYGSLARRVLGHLDDNNPNNDDVGIEGKYDYVLHGKEGVEWLRKADNREYIRDYDSTFVEVENGKDVRTTLDIELQDIAEKALKRGIEGQENIEGGCAVVMDVRTGAIRAMVNLTLEADGKGRERYNYAIGRADAPGSVFKAATLMTLLEDRKAALSDEVPTFRGKWSYNGERMPDDPYLKDWKSDKISVREGLEISSNQVFRYLVCTSYDKNPSRFINKYYEYGLGDTFDFDLTGLASPEIPMPGTPAWSGSTLPTVSYGYSIKETPLHIAMFYNAIANKGKLMKPYLVEAIEKDGKVEKRIRPEILNGSICSKSTADSLASALRSVVTDGTGRRLKSAKCEVAGKTGTARILVNFTRNGKAVSAYQDDEGRKMHQGTFVGFFPADDPQYTAIVVVYSKLSRMNFYGGSIPAEVFKEIVNSIYCLTPGWAGELEAGGKVPEMPATKLETGADMLEQIPDIKGLGLKDALYSLENCGYGYEYEGYGHVVSQSPAAGARAKKGTTVKFVLK